MNVPAVNTPLRPRQISWRNKMLRALWQLTWLFLYRPSPVPLHGWRRLVLRIFGAKIAADAHPYPSAKIWAPWNLVMREGSCLSHHCICYNVDTIVLDRHATVSQYAHLCSASRDYTQRFPPLVTASIVVGPHVWVGADAFVGAGVNLGEGAVVGARSVVMKSVPGWAVMAGNPARQIGTRPTAPFEPGEALP